MFITFRKFLEKVGFTKSVRDSFKGLIIEINSKRVIKNYYSNVKGINFFLADYPVFFVPAVNLSKVINLLNNYKMVYLYYPIRVEIDSDKRIIREGYLFRVFCNLYYPEDNACVGCELEDIEVGKGDRKVFLRVGNRDCFEIKRMKCGSSFLQLDFIESISCEGFIPLEVCTLRLKDFSSVDSFISSVEKVNSIMDDNHVDFFDLNFWLDEKIQNIKISANWYYKSLLNSLIKEGVFKRIMKVITDYYWKNPLKKCFLDFYLRSDGNEEIFFSILPMFKEDWEKFPCVYSSLKVGEYFEDKNLVKKSSVLFISVFFRLFQSFREGGSGALCLSLDKKKLKFIFDFLDKNYKEDMSDESLIELSKDLEVLMALGGID